MVDGSAIVLFSSLPPDQLPAVGDAVRIGYAPRQYRVTARYRINATGQVILCLDDGTEHPVELIHWAPLPGDTVQLIHKNTIDWYTAMEGYAKFAIEFGDHQWRKKRDLIRDWQIEASTPGSWFFLPTRVRLSGIVRQS